jgi:hypothetical protein
MSKTLVRDPLAIGSDGTVLLNLLEVCGTSRPEELLQRALEQGGPVFIGVGLTQAEIDLARERLGHSAAEAAARLVAGRLRPRRRRAR